MKQKKYEVPNKQGPGVPEILDNLTPDGKSSCKRSRNGQSQGETSPLEITNPIAMASNDSDLDDSQSKEFKGTIINMFKDSKKDTSKHTKECKEDMNGLLDELQENTNSWTQ